MLRYLLILLVFFTVFPIDALHAQADLKSVQDVTRADPSPKDTQLNDAIRSALEQDASLHPALGDVQLKTVDGVVHLKGTVSSEAQRKAIEDKIHAVPGVSEVKSFIRIAGN